jgi:hypothetical protein
MRASRRSSVAGMLELMFDRLRHIVPSAPRSRFPLWGLACVVLAASACDPDVSFAPVGWRDRDHGWLSSQDGMEISMVSGPFALVSAERLSLSLEVENRSAGQVVFESASLTTLGRTYTEAFTTKPVAPLEWTVQPGGKRSIWFFFALDRPVVRAVGPTADIGLFYRRGGGPLRRLSIRLQKERKWSWPG